MNPCVFVLLMLIALPVHAWGNLGHRVTGMLAESMLNESTRREVALLLNGESLADATTFMDRERDTLAMRFTDSPRWHYDNVPVCGKDTHCQDGQCASAQLRHWQQVLADRHATRESRALALRLIVHIVGDLHQPLHAADHHDRGGNDILIGNHTLGSPQNLHSLLDTELVRRVANKRSARQLAHLWRNRFASRFDAWQTGTPASWLAETHALAVRNVYTPLPGFVCQRQPDAHVIVVEDSYLQQMEQLIPEQLTKAGVRLAWLLNRTLS